MLFPGAENDSALSLGPGSVQGHAKAQTNLGFMQQQGLGVPQDYKAAMNWYKRAVETGLALAQYNLGVMYAYGQGVTQDYRASVKWLKLAAEQGFANAQNNL